MLSHSDPPALHRSPLVDTCNPDEFRETIVSTFGARGFDFGNVPQFFRASRSYLRLKSIDVAYGACSAPYKVYFPGSAMIKQHFVSRNNGRTRFGGKQFDIGPEESAVIPAWTEMTHEYEADLEQSLFRIEAPALQSKLSAVVGMPVTRDIEFVTPSLFTNPSLQRLRRMLRFMVDEFDRDDGGIPPAAMVEFEQLLIVSFLTANRHNFSELMDREQPRPAPWQVRMVEEYIHANWNQPITVEALAAAAGASTRSVFKAFRDARSCSPMAFVKGIRLTHARRLLQKPDQGATVVSVAFACGFLNAGHFARDYRRAFGELPSATLAYARHQRH